MIAGGGTVLRPAAQAIAAGPALVAGPTGQSNYDLWLGQGNVGPVGAFLASLIGPAGPAGQAGSAGATGATGPAGINGTNGNTLLNGSGAPSGAVGSTGDFYIDPTAQIIYGPKAAGAWPSGVSYKGSTGAAGNTGPPGNTGATGTNGAAWYSGSGAPGTVAGAVNGDWYLNTANGDLYRMVSGAWSLQMNLTATSGTLHYDTTQSLGDAQRATVQLNALLASSDRLAINGIKLAKVLGAPIYEPDGLVDGFATSTGIDPASTNALLSGMAIINQGTDVNTKALLHFDGTNGNQTTSDAVAGHTITFNGSAAISTTQSVFGGASLAIPSGTSGSLSIASSADFGWGTGDFCIEFRVYPIVNGTSCLFDMRDGGSNGLGIYLQSGIIVVKNNSATVLTGTAAVATSAWSSIALTRSGGVLRLYVNGTVDTSVTGNTTSFGSASAVRIGANSSGGEQYPCFIDEMRLSNTARYITSTYAVASSAFTTTVSGPLDLRSVVVPLLVVPTRGILYVRVKQTAGTLNFGSGGNFTGSISRTGDATAGSLVTFTQVNSPAANDNSFILLRSNVVDLTVQTLSQSLVYRLQTSGSLGVMIDGADVRAVA